MKRGIKIFIIGIILIFNTILVNGETFIPQHVKVGILFNDSNVDNVIIEGDSILKIYKNDNIIHKESRITLKKDGINNIIVCNDERKELFRYDVKKDNVYFIGKEYLYVNKKAYRGKIIANRFLDSDLTIINELSLTDYLKGVVPKEISYTWPKEALKAQAVAARNFTLSKMNLHKEHGFDLCASTHCQVYGGYSSENIRSSEAVMDTKGVILTYKNKPVVTYYHSNSGGITENMENVWSSKINYIRSKQDPYSIGAPNDSWQKVYTRLQIEKIINDYDYDIGSLKELRVNKRAESGRVLQLEIIGSRNKVILEKDAIRKVFGYNNIKSTLFEIIDNTNTDKIAIQKPFEDTASIHMGQVYIKGKGKQVLSKGNIYVYNGIVKSQINYSDISENIIFKGKGWGHGLGMSQWGAKKMAEEGFSYEDILKFYYNETELQR